MCPLGLPGRAPAGMLQENCSETFSVSPQYAWNLDYLHSVTFPAAALYLSNRAMWLSLYTAALHLCVCHTCPHLCVCHTHPHLLSTSWPCGPLVNSDVLFFITPSAACKHFGLLTVFFHLWEATATSQAFSASLNPEEDQLPSFPEGRVTPPHPSLHCLQAKRREHYRFCF